MKSEFSNFLVKIQIPIPNTPSLFEQNLYLYSEPQIVRDHLSHLFEQILHIAHTINDRNQLRNEVLQIQTLMTDLINKYQYQTVSQQILKKLINFLQALQDEFPNEFNHHAAYPSFAYSLIQPELIEKQEEVLSLLSKSKVNPKLLAILKNYFDKPAGKHRLQPSWVNIQYLTQIMDEIQLIYQKTDSNSTSIEVNLLKVFIRNNFNKRAIVAYWVAEFEELFEKTEQDQDACINYLLLICDSAVYRELAYNKNAISLQEQLKTILNARKKFLEDEADRKYKEALSDEKLIHRPVYINAPAEVIALFFRASFEVGAIREPQSKTDFYNRLREFIRGPKGNKYEKSTLLKGASVESVKHIERLVDYLQEIINRLQDIKEVFLKKK